MWLMLMLHASLATCLKYFTVSAHPSLAADTERALFEASFADESALFFANTEDSRRLARGHVDVGRPKRRESPHVNYLLKRREPAHVVAGRLIVSSGLALTRAA